MMHPWEPENSLTRCRLTQDLHVGCKSSLYGLPEPAWDCKRPAMALHGAAGSTLHPPRPNPLTNSRAQQS